MVHFDNLRWWGGPEACRRDRCAAKFREFVAAGGERESFRVDNLKTYAVVSLSETLNDKEN